MEPDWGAFWTFTLVMAFVWALLSVAVAHHKDRNKGIWAFAGFFLGLFAFIVLLCLPTSRPLKCPQCAERLRREARICMYCGYKFYSAGAV